MCRSFFPATFATRLIILLSIAIAIAACRNFSC
jgi:hypothetical protein